MTSAVHGPDTNAATIPVPSPRTTAVLNSCLDDNKLSQTLHPTPPHPLFFSSPFLTGAENPTYLKEPTDKALFAFGVAGIVFGSLQILGGLYNMALGVNKIK